MQFRFAEKKTTSQKEKDHAFTPARLSWNP